MNEALDRYLVQAYRRDVLGESVKVEPPMADAKTIAQIEAEIARIDGLHLGAHLANRDFVSYQSKRALTVLLVQLRAELEARTRAQELKAQQEVGHAT
ncbi:MAG: hypothetical protein C5B60_03445 [Chloroflexi bacterium]|nr:MAG: hypothetical protein C5B60_03445 [Chloroflexota bacterium]